MSSYIKKLKHPITGKEQLALCIDDYYGSHEYGYGFRKDGKDGEWDTPLEEYDFFRDGDVEPSLQPQDNQATSEEPMQKDSNLCKPMQESWEEELNRILDGIDLVELYGDSGWWETNSGARFGAEKLEEVKSFIRELLQAQKDKIVEEIQKEIQKESPHNGPIDEDCPYCTRVRILGEAIDIINQI